jgi:hypothetical protein
MHVQEEDLCEHGAVGDRDVDQHAAGIREHEDMESALPREADAG